jgi:phage gpG-like protein
MEVKVTVLGGEQFVRRMNGMASGLERVRSDAARVGAQMVQGFAMREGFYIGSVGVDQGPPKPDKLTSRTGNLRGSIRTENGPPGVAYVGPTAVYGAIHEFGGTIQQRAMTRLAGGRRIAVAKLLKSGKYSTKQTVRATQRVRAHERGAYAIHMPARPYLRPAFQKHEREIQDAMIRRIIRGLGGGAA